MNILFLQTLPLTGVSGDPVLNLLKGIIGAFIVFFIAFILILFALYVYLSVVYSKIGSKARLSSPGIAWMPFTGVLAVIFESSKMHWWPFLILIIGFSSGYILILSSFAIGSTMMTLATIILFATTAIFAIMTIVWHWKTYEAVGKPGWWILVPVISGILGLGLILIRVSVLGIIIAILGAVAHLVLIGIAAWSKSSSNQ